MSNINYLVPGYTEQGFSYARSQLYEGVVLLKKKQELLGTISMPVVYVINTAFSLCLELPIKLIEDVALTLINLFGAVFNEKCRKHLSECMFQLFVDITKVIPVIIIAAPFILPLPPHLKLASAGLSALIAANIGVKMIGHLLDPQQVAHFCLIPFYRTQAIRIHGYADVSKFEKLLGLNKEMRQRIPSEVMTFYKKLTEENGDSFLNATLEKEQKRIKILEEKAKKADTADPLEAEKLPSLGKEWVSPEELNDHTTTATVISRILYLSENMHPDTMNQEQVYVYLHNLLGISPSSDPLNISEAWTTTHLVLHEEKNRGTKYEGSAKTAREALENALQYSELREHLL